MQLPRFLIKSLQYFTQKALIFERNREVQNEFDFVVAFFFLFFLFIRRIKARKSD